MMQYKGDDNFQRYVHKFEIFLGSFWCGQHDTGVWRCDTDHVGTGHQWQSTTSGEYAVMLDIRTTEAGLPSALAARVTTDPEVASTNPIVTTFMEIGH